MNADVLVDQLVELHVKVGSVLVLESNVQQGLLQLLLAQNIFSMPRVRLWSYWPAVVNSFHPSRNGLPIVQGILQNTDMGAWP